jgi:protein TonB
MSSSFLPPDPGRAGEFPQLTPGASVHMGAGEVLLKEESLFSSLMNTLRDAFFPRKLPPLVLESQPVAVVDRMAVKRDPTSTAVAVVLHVVIIGLLVYLVAQRVRIIDNPKTQAVVAIDAPPPPAPPKLKVMGGGGGQKGPAPVSKGSPPKFSPVQIVPPKAPVIAPKLAVAPTIDVDPHLKMASNLPTVGMPNAPSVGLSFGNGNGSGLGSGNGNGMGPGSGGNTGGGVRQVGGGVSAPVPIFHPEPEFSEEARKAKLTGNVEVSITVDKNGNATMVHVIRGLGMGLDEKAVEAVKTWRFKPAMENGKPVPVEVYIDVGFNIL